MSTDPDRNRATDHLLKKALLPDDPANAVACVEAETLAAWADGGLSAERAVELEAHVARCARCQAMMAALANTEETAHAAAAGAAAVLPFRPRATMRWLVPVAASLAATVFLWVAVKNRDTATEPEQTMAKTETAPPSPALVPPPAQTPQLAQRSVAPTPSPSAKASKRRAEPAPVAPPPITATGAAAAQPLPTVAPAQTVMATPPPPPATRPVAAGAAASRGEVVILRSDTDPIRTDTATLSQSKVVAEFAPADPVSPNAGRSFVSGGRGGAAAGAGGGGRAAATAERVGSRLRWRVLASGQVMKSTNGGETWTLVTIYPTVFILNGSAPSPTVCWLVGRAGIVMLSTDGTKFTRVIFPDLSDLRSIVAIDARQATVTTTDGRVFATFDGGETWELKKIDGVQDSQPKAF